MGRVHCKKTAGRHQSFLVREEQAGYFSSHGSLTFLEGFVPFLILGYDYCSLKIQGNSFFGGWSTTLSPIEEILIGLHVKEKSKRTSFL
jgi:hypothetical protein